VQSAPDQEFVLGQNPQTLVEPREISYSTDQIERQVFYGSARLVEGDASLIVAVSASNYWGSVVQPNYQASNSVVPTIEAGPGQPAPAAPGQGLLRFAGSGGLSA
jgi:hypothetical protein